MSDKQLALHDLLHAAETGDVEVVRKFVEESVLRNRVVEDNALQFACEHGQIAVARYLIKQGAYIDLQFQLRHALNAGQLEMVTFLVEQGADIHAIKERALIDAARKAHYPIMRYLLSLGTDPKLDFRTAPEEVREWIAQYINSSTLNDKLQSSLPEKEDKPVSKVNDGKL